MTQRIHVVARPGERWIALCADDRLVEFILDRPDAGSRVGAIMLGRVQRVDKALDAAFVAIDRGTSGFLPLQDAHSKPLEGQPILVQISRDARGEKAPRLTGKPILIGRRLALSPFGSQVIVPSHIGSGLERERIAEAMHDIAEAGEGWFLRRASAQASQAELADESDRLRRLWRGLLRRSESVKPPMELHREDDPLIRMLRDSQDRLAEIVFDTRAGANAARQVLEDELPEFVARVVHRPTRSWAVSAAEIRDQVQAALEPEVPLRSGARLLFEPGQTLTAIDVDSAGASGQRPQNRSDRTHFEVNLDAAREISRQIRLRNLGGILVIDFIDMANARNRRKVVNALREAVAHDSAPCSVASTSLLGLVEMTRRRRGESLAEALTMPCAACDGTGRLPAPDTGLSPSVE